MELSSSGFAACHRSHSSLISLFRPQHLPHHLRASLFLRNCKLPRRLSFTNSFLPMHRLQVKCSAVNCSIEEETCFRPFSGLGDVEGPVLVCRTQTLPSVLSLHHAREALFSATSDLQSDPPRLCSGILRVQVPFSTEIRALKWLQAQKGYTTLLPRFYFSPRGQCAEGFHEEDIDILKGVAGIGSAVCFNGKSPFSSKDIKCVKRFLSKDSSLIRAYGSMRFNADMEPSEEWRAFGSFFFFIPQIEYCECPSFSLLAVTIAWDEELGRNFDEAAEIAKASLLLLSDEVSSTSQAPIVKTFHKEHVPCEQEWHGIMKDLLETLECNETNCTSASDEVLISPEVCNTVGLSKVVLARKTKVEVDAILEPLSLLSILQEKDPIAYQFCMQLPNGNAFIGSTPERLFYKDGTKVFSEAVAATRARGITDSKDCGSSIELLLSAKDHVEFDIVMDNMKQRLEVVCKDVKVKLYKGLIRQANVQHLYGCFSGQLFNEDDEFQLLMSLHPTPAVCGYPQNLAKQFLTEKEAFDRGMYAGPVGWISGDKSEFAVAIRSSLLSHNPSKTGTLLYLYAGVGIVKGAKSLSEWRELDLKIQQFETLLQPTSILINSVNINALWAKVIVEECCRLGVTYFCIAPGSRSSPLAVAAAENHKANCISCVDERSLAFHALGYGRGACKPAVVITSSGTAVSNLLPAVVEAHEDCIPLILLTADRPPELQQTGANQTIDQVKHFGSFARYEINLPAPTADIQARMVLTSIDAAIFRATSNPMGPVHINIAFREPLAGTPHAWDADCLKGLERWALTALPFTKYVKMVGSNAVNSGRISCGDMRELLGSINSASRGLLIIGGLHKVEESWSAVLLAKHLGWPVVADILSGVRLRHLNSLDENSELCIIDYFDHMLLSMNLQDLIKPDVVLQIGGRLTSKRVLQFLDLCQPSTYILVEEHPFRQDPCHLLTHRVHSSTTEFVKEVMSCCTPCKPREYAKQLQHFSDMIRKEISFQLDTEPALSEPHVARIVANSLTLDSALFLGNSMAVRDADMYCEGSLIGTRNLSSEYHDLPRTLVRMAGNRGASGIDGILSTAIGFAAGYGQRVTLLLGDISFLHDTNGLMLLKRRACQPPVVVVVVNNSGGGIFSFLPIANTASPTTFTKFFTTPQNVSIRQLCLAHKINHTVVQSRKQLVTALDFIQRQQLNWIVEVESSVEDNAEFHRHLQTSTKQAIRRALQVTQEANDFLGQNRIDFSIQEAVFYPYRILLRTHPTTIQGSTGKSEYREGLIFRVCLNNGACGYGEVAPLQGLHEETLEAAAEQLQLLGKLLQNVKINNTLALLNGGFSKWLSKSVGLLPNTLFPTVRCGMEMAVLGALASANNCSIVELLNGTRNDRQDLERGNNATMQQMSDISSIRICGLLDSAGSPAEMASSALNLVSHGFCTLKIKVARRDSPLEDAAILVAIREAVGPRIHLRADANQLWTFDEAVEFANAVRGCGLQYLEEPVKDLGDLVRFCKETGLPVALDESIDKNPEEIVKLFPHLGLAAAIIKPSAVGGFELAALIAKWAQRNGMLAVISSAFESSISLSVYAQFAAFVNERRLESIIVNEADRKAKLIPPVAHGLGTYMWLENDVVCQNRFSINATGDGIEISMQDAANTFKDMILDSETVQLERPMINVHSQIHTVESGSIEYAFHVMDTYHNSKDEQQSTVLVFLHGFLGRCNDWLPIMEALSISSRCISIDLPGHGRTRTSEESACDQASDSFSIEKIAEALSSLLRHLSKKKVVLVGYSMGARIALYMALRCNKQVLGAVIVSGSPGIREDTARRERTKQDDALSELLLKTGLESFVATWYQKPMWSSLRRHPCFPKVVQARLEHQDRKALARILSSLSVGRQPSLWDDLVNLTVPLLIVVGRNDKKFMQIACKMYDRVNVSRVSMRTETESKREIICNERWAGNVSEEERHLEEMLFIEKEAHLHLGIREQNGFPGKIYPIQADEQGNEVGKTKYVTLLEAENTGHAVHVENPFLIVRGISHFLTRLNQANISH